MSQNQPPNALAELSRDFNRKVMGSATKLLDEWVGADRAAEAKGRIAAAFSAAALSAKKPEEFYACTTASVAQCIATAALTGMMPGTGAAALAYLVPRRARKDEAPHLQFQLSHRGLAALARRAGLVLIAVPAGYNDTLRMRDGEVAEFENDPDEPPMGWDDMRGVVVIVKDARSSAVLFRGWVAKRVIEERRARSDSFRYAEKNDWAKANSTWHQWPIEMGMKTALHYAVSRGWAVIDDTEAVRALSLDNADIIDVVAQPAEKTAPPKQSTRALLTDDYEPTPDFAAEAERLAEREEVPVRDPEPEVKPKAKAAPPPDLGAVLEAGGATVAQLDAWRASQAKPLPPVSDLTDAQRGQLAAWLAADPSRVAALLPTEAPAEPAEEKGEEDPW